MKPTLYDYTSEELKSLVDKPFRAKQLVSALYHQYASTFEEITTFSKNLRQDMSQKYSLSPAKIVREEISEDGSRKYLLEMHDGHTCETVLLLMKDEQLTEDGKTIKQAQYTVCVSTQIGCKVGCSFCLTAKGGFVRNLSAGEIVAQIVEIKRLHNFPAEKRLNIVYMGMGEPLDNFDNVVKAINIFADPNGLAIAPRRQTLSTSGISSKIKRLGELELDIQLAISLHAVDNSLRQELIPMNKAFPIETIIEAVKNFPMRHRRSVLFEYLVIKDVNDDKKSAKKLIKLLEGIKAKVNLIYFNPFPGTNYQRPTNAAMKEFQQYLADARVMCTIRQSKGLDISAACGQLKEQTET
jgi:23S rRNA (adenine2503-C2)-methyltransferase